MKPQKSDDLRIFLLLAVPAEIIYLACHYYFLSRIPGNPWTARLVLVCGAAFILLISRHFSKPSRRRNQKTASRRRRQKNRQRHEKETKKKQKRD